jgi:hypothetical protein
MVVPYGVISFRICGVVIHHFHIGCVISVYGQGCVCVMGRYKVGHHSARNAQSTTHCKKFKGVCKFSVTLGEEPRLTIRDIRILR